MAGGISDVAAAASTVAASLPRNGTTAEPTSCFCVLPLLPDEVPLPVLPGPVGELGDPVAAVLNVARATEGWFESRAV